MRNMIALVLLATLSVSASAQTKPPTLSVRTVGDRTNVFQYTRSDIEIFPTQRAAPIATASGGNRMTTMQVESAATPFSTSQRGVVFNYALQQYGVTTGEIAFMLKRDSSLSMLQLDPALNPKKIMKSGVYVVTARSPQSFLDTVRKLQQNSAVTWVEPTIEYGPVQFSPSLR